MATFYIVENNQQAGPFSVEQLRAKGIAPETYVWSEGMSGWEQASKVSELQVLFQPAQPQYQAQPQTQTQAYTETVKISEPAQPAQPAQPQYQAPPQYQAQPAQPQYQAQPQQQSYAQPQRSTTDSGDMMPKPQDWKPYSIALMVASVVCCGVCGGIISLILGVLAYQSANKVDNLYNMKDFAGAKAASDKARLYVIIGGVIVVVGFFVGLVVYILAIAANS